MYKVLLVLMELMLVDFMFQVQLVVLVETEPVAKVEPVAVAVGLTEDGARLRQQRWVAARGAPLLPPLLPLLPNGCLAVAIHPCRSTDA